MITVHWSSIAVIIGLTALCAGGLNGCGLAQGGGYSEIHFQASDGAVCYIIFDGGQRAGANCK